ncbi:hypothetical protein [Bacillus cereus]|uniref:hypothetical protein n=1 Tax=Bacillus cereus TaxID=1396 RepID=UPI00027A9C25|nr:hypothetical protein [Bacillus cereus]EJS65802.1 hypothetical protein ICU_03876 [Bacillus cereus BAG2X1-1]EJS73945.1 hypothetical protein ICY_03731 [Bacillus cereus BAG2X1-3]PEA07891.1 hypothetical protein CON38_19575 [Bacillus cereus]PFI26342.1 hypothetical protein COI75_01630 [Bacillus cereus]
MAYKSTGVFRVPVSENGIIPTALNIMLKNKYKLAYQVIAIFYAIYLISPLNAYIINLKYGSILGIIINLSCFIAVIICVNRSKI